jgi:hypothetical protein
LSTSFTHHYLQCPVYEADLKRRAGLRDAQWVHP